MTKIADLEKNGASVEEINQLRSNAAEEEVKLREDAVHQYRTD